MKKQVSIYWSIGAVWLACCMFQVKNDNMFMAVVSTILAVLFLVLGACLYYKNNKR